MMLEFLHNQRQWGAHVRGQETPFTWGMVRRVFIRPENVNAISFLYDTDGEEYVFIAVDGAEDVILRQPHTAFHQEYWQVFGLPNPYPAQYPETEEEEDEDVDDPEDNLIDA